jgi:hypothetical protein
MDHFQALEAIEHEARDYITPELCDRLGRLARHISYRIKVPKLEQLAIDYSDLLEREIPHSSVVDHMIKMCKYYLDGKFTENSMTEHPVAKRSRKNPEGQNMYLANGDILSEEKSILACQRIWSHYAYKPGGYMYKKMMDDFKYEQAKDQFKKMNV